MSEQTQQIFDQVVAKAVADVEIKIRNNWLKLLLLLLLLNVGSVGALFWWAITSIPSKATEQAKNYAREAVTKDVEALKNEATRKLADVIESTGQYKEQSEAISREINKLKKQRDDLDSQIAEMQTRVEKTKETTNARLAELAARVDSTRLDIDTRIASEVARLNVAAEQIESLQKLAAGLDSKDGREKLELMRSLAEQLEDGDPLRVLAELQTKIRKIDNSIEHGFGKLVCSRLEIRPPIADRGGLPGYREGMGENSSFFGPESQSGRIAALDEQLYGGSLTILDSQGREVAYIGNRFFNDGHLSLSDRNGTARVYAIAAVDGPLIEVLDPYVLPTPHQDAGLGIGRSAARLSSDPSGDGRLELHRSSGELASIGVGDNGQSRISLYDTMSKERVLIEAATDSARVALVSAVDERTIVAGIYDNSGRGGLRLAGTNQKTRVLLGTTTDDSGGVLSLHNSDGSVAFNVFSMGDGGAILSLTNPQDPSKVASSWGVAKDLRALFFFDREGKSLVGLGMHEDGTTGVVVTDKNGKQKSWP